MSLSGITMEHEVEDPSFWIAKLTETSILAQWAHVNSQ